MRADLMLTVIGLLTGVVFGQMPTHPVPGQIAPGVHATELQQAPGWMEAGEIDLAELRGKVVYVKFWSTGCWPCIQAMPEHNRLKEKYGDKLVYLGVTPQTLDEIAEFMAGRETSMVVLSDPEQKTWWRYYPRGEGSGTLICPDGRVSRVSVNDLELNEEMIEMALRNEYEDGPPIDMNGEILPHAHALGIEWGKARGEQKSLTGQDPYSLAQEAAFQIICRPSWSNGKFVGSGARDRFTWLSARALWIIKSCVRVHGFEGLGNQTPESRIIGPDWLSERYFDFIYNLPGVETAQQQVMIEAALEQGMGVAFSREVRTVSGYRMEWVDVDQRPDESKAERSQWLGGHELDDGRMGTLVKNYSLEELGRKFEDRYGVPVVYHGDTSAYDFHIPSPVTCSLEEMSVHMQQVYGLRLLPTDVEVEVLVVRERQTLGGR